MNSALRLALVGNPNAGKSALFNALTGSRQKTGNYPGTTVERRAGRFQTQHGLEVNVVDLPGTYSLSATSPDQVVTREVVLGQRDSEPLPDVILCVVDATNLKLHLRLVLELKQLGRPMLIALNMIDLATRDKIDIDVEALESALGIPVIPTVAVRRSGVKELSVELSNHLNDLVEEAAKTGPAPAWQPQDLKSLQKEAGRIAKVATRSEGIEHLMTRRLDAVFLHKIAGPLILFAMLFVMFQAVFAWAETPMEWIDMGIGALADGLTASLPDNALRSLLVDGVIAGVGSVVVFLPQILILFAFILALEASGYMARGAFLMDRIMASVGLNGRAFIPLLSSFACAIPGIMATRTIDNPRDRLTTIMIAPLMTCSARIPVYTLLIAAFIPNQAVGGIFNLQGVVLFALYLAGIVSALIVAGVLKRTVTKGASQSLLMELPKYQLPNLRDLVLGLYERVKIFMARAGKFILTTMIVLWVLASYPAAPADAALPDIYYSYAGQIGRVLEILFAPIGFTWEIAISLVPGMAAREVFVGALGTVYALSGSEDQIATSLVSRLQNAWSLPTALAVMAWYVYAPQCLATLAVAKRETNSWGWMFFMAGYLTAIAYLAAGITYWTATAIIG